MRYRNLMLAASVPALLVLGACDPTTNRLTPDACAKAQLALVLAEVNSDLVPPETIDRLRRNIVILCPPEVAEELEAEIETEVGEDVALPLDVIAPPAE